MKLPRIDSVVHHPLRVWAITSAAALLAGVSLLVHSGGSGAADAPATAQAVPALVAAVDNIDIPMWESHSGRLEAIERVEVRSRAAGVVLAVHFVEGTLVAQGQLLYTIDPAPYQAELDRSQAHLMAARARADHTVRELARARALLDERAIAQREHDERLNSQQEAEAALLAARAALTMAQLSLGYTEVRAPVAGRVGRNEVTIGNVITAGAGAPVLTRLVSVHPIYATFDADERSVARILQTLAASPGARRALEQVPVQLQALGDPASAPRMGRLQLVDNQVDAASGTVRLRAVFDNRDGRLMPGQYAQLRLGQPRAQSALLVNERAIQTDQNRKFVWVLDSGNHARYREVALGAEHDGQRVISRGLQAGERVIVDGLHRVRPGVLINAKPAPQVRANPGAGPA